MRQHQPPSKTLRMPEMVEVIVYYSLQRVGSFGVTFPKMIG